MGSIGILGGSFDPPHTAHISMARTALDRVPLDRVLFMPAPNPPHKRRDSMSPYESRKAMVAIAIRDEEGMELSVAEEIRDGPSYTHELLRSLRTQSDDGLYFILGADSVADLPNWRDPKSILDLATDASIVLFEEPVIDVSSTEIREKCRRGESTAGLIPERVRNFILDNSLYS
jgi:nicotinate-nucleotide adenylyltransferase